MKILVADVMHESLFAMLDAAGFEAESAPFISRDELRTKLSEYDGLILRSKTRVDHDLLGDAPRVRIIARAGAGIDNLDEAFLNEKKIHIVNAPEGNRNAVGEHCLGMLLSLMNHLRQADTEVRQETWDREGNRGHELQGKTVGLIGYGNMGMSFARKLSGMSCKVLAYDKYKKHYSDKFALASGMDRIFDEADIISLHVPLTEETRFMIDEEFFAKFSRPIYFLNSARGEIVRLSALAASLKRGLLVGAGLDVLENEKLQTLTAEQEKAFRYLTKRNDVLFTPHVGGWSFESYVRINEVLVSKLAEWRAAL